MQDAPKKVLGSWVTTLTGVALTALGLHHLYYQVVVWYEATLLVVAGVLLIWVKDPEELLTWGDRISAWFKKP